MAERLPSYTITELRELYLREPDLDYQLGNIRFLPTDVCNTASEMVNHEVSLMEVLEYVNSAFDIFRACVNNNPFAGVPHVLVKGMYEWPKMADISWSSVDEIKTFGTVLRSRPDAISIVGPDEVTQITKSGETTTRRINELESYQRSMPDTIKFLIPSLNEVGLVTDMMGSWQSRNLERFVSKFHQLSLGLTQGFFEDKQFSRQFISQELDLLQFKPYQERVGIYRKTAPKSIGDLFRNFRFFR